MNPQEQVCHTPRCWVYGREEMRNIVIHSQKEQRYRCKRCGKTFSASKDTPFYRIHKPQALVVTVVTLLAHGCPVQAIVAAFGVDECTVADWQRRAGDHCARVHRQFVQAGQVDLGQVQADEVRVRAVGAVGERRAVWMAMAISVVSRVWLGGVVSARRDRRLIAALLAQVRACGAVTTLLLCSDGLSSYPRQAARVFRQAVRTGGRGRPRLVLPAGVLMAQVVKQYAKRRVTAVAHRIVRGCRGAVAGDGASVCDAERRDVAGGSGLQLLHAAPQPRGADARTSGGTDGSSLDDARTAPPARAAASGETAGPPARMAAGGALCCLTTL